MDILVIIAVIPLLIIFIRAAFQKNTVGHVGGHGGGGRVRIGHFPPGYWNFYWKWLHYIIISFIFTHFYFKSSNFLSTFINHNRLQFLSLFTLRTYYRENCSNSPHSTPRFLMSVLFSKRPSTFSCMSSVLQFLLIVEWTEAFWVLIILFSSLGSLHFYFLYSISTITLNMWLVRWCSKPQLASCIILKIFAKIRIYPNHY